MKKTFSVRRFLLVSLLGTLLIFWGLAAILSYRDARHEISELFDAQLAQSARTILEQVEHEIGELEDRPEPESGFSGFKEEREGRRDREYHRYAQRIYFQIWDADGRLLMRSGPDVLKTPLLAIDSGFGNRDIEGQGYRVFVLWERHGRYQIQVAQRQSVRDRFSAELSLHIMIPLLLAFPILALLIGWAVTWALRPMKEVAKQVSELKSDRLEPLGIERIPVEVEPLIEALNSLFARLRGELEKERRFTSDASHELRTPLSALKAQVEVALGASTDEAKDHALRQILKAVDRMSHLIAQLLTAARLDPDATLQKKEPVDLSIVSAEVLRELAPMAVAKKIDLGFEEKAGGAQIQGNAAMLGVLVRNLVDNSIRYTPEGGHVRVLIGQENGEIVLTVRDTGPGIPAEERARVFDRFYRSPGSPGQGSGLGLSIVRRIVEIHSGRIELSGPPGLQVRVFFLFSS